MCYTKVQANKYYMKNKKNILITGSSNGIGAGIAKHFGELGYSVIVTYKSNKADGEKVVKQIQDNGGEALLVKLEVTDENSVKNVFEVVKNKFGKLDVLVNNAAVDWITPIETSTFEEWKEITRSKIDGNYLCTKHAIPLLKKSENPNLIMIVSSLYENVDSSDPAYCVGTAGVVTFMKCMAVALSKYGIRTNGVGPSETKTNMKYWKIAGSEKAWKEIEKNNPLGKLCTPEYVANTIQLIVEDKSKFLNGNIIYVTGGNHLTRGF
jgi:3-oxoacyl-[acyl-carrier protein] reductase